MGVTLIFPLIWMLHSKVLNYLINNIRKSAPTLSYKDNQSSSKELLEKDHSATVHHKNLQVTEIFKVKDDLAPGIIKDIFRIKEPTYKLQSEMLRLLTMIS